ncbi:hypothetical protein RFI_37411 [Reticulomyxa filosa]|uniref:TRAF-type domain-containing protein n=1 Tax=Reticulomyxa filosa TaxID=46433 RepID=X6LFY0_RETFI|nr:hypothetical protein RFI_37411 [Reticulomyxa filosa]|eukprot:ETO00047.1 hypothetical protein RFI_37411 [Reticulomyxa filosa]
MSSLKKGLSEEAIKRSLLGECYNTEWVLFLHKQDAPEDFECLICKQITNNAVKLTCKEHEDASEEMFVGEKCLNRYLEENDSQCPIDDHNPCRYKKGITIRKKINNLTVMCPRQFAKDTNADLEMKLCCKFNGKIKDIKEHLEESCPLRPLECRFKKFGCDEILFQSNFGQHLQLQLKKHLDLLISHIGELQKELEHHQTCQVSFVVFFFNKKNEKFQSN